MANTDEIKNPAITKLIAKAKAAGYISNSAISELIETAGCDVEQLEKVYETLEELGIEITGSDDLTELIDDDSFIEEIVSIEEEMAEDEENDGGEPYQAEETASDNHIRLYLKDIGKVPLLTTELENELSERIIKIGRAHV